MWGAATASYQIEGAALEDGRSECIWTRFSHTPGKVKNGDTGDVACDHYHRYPQDIELIQSLGLRGYRFSVAWPRVLPGGTGAVNAAGLDFYDRLVDGLLAAGIMPAATLYHWDLPQVLEDRGGWTNVQIVDWFSEYTDVVTKRLGDRVKFWLTLNEPWCTAFLGYFIGRHAPGITDERLAYRAAHHTMLAHAAAVPIIRANSPGAQVGIALNLAPQTPATDHPEDVRLAHRADAFQNRWFLDAVFKGSYPADLVEDLQARGILDGLEIGNVSGVNVPLDFLGVNYYMRFFIAHDPNQPGKTTNPFPPGTPMTAMDWEIYPQGMADMLLRVTREYNPPPMYITENGAAFAEPDHVEGDVLEDPLRVDFLRGYFAAAEAAIAQGAPLRGYFVWSLLDNFEWAEGYTKRFGVVHVDFETQKRTPKRSAHYLRDVIRSGTL